MTKILLEGKKDVRNNILTFYPSSLDPKKNILAYFTIFTLMAPFSEQAESKYHSLHFLNQQTQNIGAILLDIKGSRKR